MQVHVVHGFPERRPVLAAELAVQPNVREVSWGKVRTGRDWMQGPFQPCPYWRDLKLEARLVTDGEMCCTLGHHDALFAIAKSGRPGLILEDDAKLVGTIPTVEEFNALGCDLLYLAGKDMDGTRPESPHYHPGMLWWALAYIVTSQAAHRILAAMGRENGDRPHDERLINAYSGRFYAHDDHGLVSRPEKYLDALAAYPRVVEPRGLWSSGTDGSASAFDLKVALTATDPSRAERTFRSFRDKGHDVALLGSGQEGWDTNGEGGRRKLAWQVEWLNAQAPNTIALLSDGYDVTCQSDPPAVLRKYGHLLHPMVVSGETNYWPNRNMQDRFHRMAAWPREQVGKYRFPCSGLMIGPAPDLARSLEQAMDDNPDEADDQALVQRAVLATGTERWRIDRDAYLLRSMGGAPPLFAGRDQATGMSPDILHWNGPGEMPTFNGIPSNVAYDGGSEFMEVAPDILAFRLMSPEDAERVAEYLDTRGGWKPLPGDNVPGDEMRLLEAGLDDMAKALLDACARRHAIRWTPPAGSIYHKDSFAIRYSRGRQAGIRLHNDRSFVSATLVLRKAERGGVLRFPRQELQRPAFGAGGGCSMAVDADAPPRRHGRVGRRPDVRDSMDH